MTEALPMAVTALLPVVLMPWLDVAGSKTLCQNYLKVCCASVRIPVSVFMQWCKYLAVCHCIRFGARYFTGRLRA